MAAKSYTYNFYINGFQDAKITIDALLKNVQDESFKTRPAEGKWCMGEILSHLIETGHEYLNQIKKELDKPAETLPKGSGPFRHNFFFQWFIKQVSPANKRKLPTVSKFEPKAIHDLDKEKLLTDFHLLQDDFLKLIQKAKENEIDIGRLKTKNPVIKWVSMSISSCFALTEAHQRRHFGQIRDIQKKFSENT